MTSKFISRRGAIGRLASGALLTSFSSAGNTQTSPSTARSLILAGYQTAITRYRPVNRGTGVAVDFGLPSNVARLYIMGNDGQPMRACLVGHGKGSAPRHELIPIRFDGPPKSNTSVLGALKGERRYVGKHGLSLRLDGLEPSNRSARSRLIVIHQADYMESDFVQRIGKPGRSQGCFVLQRQDLEAVITALEGGGILWAGR
jgi:L,D-transpeptidase catalytic domain